MTDAAAMGIPWPPPGWEAEPDGVWPDNLTAVQAFLTVATQWRSVLGDTGLVRLGLDYQGVQAGLALAGITVTPALWADIRLVEAGAVQGGRR